MGFCFVLAVLLTWAMALQSQNAPANSVFYQCNNTFVSVAVKVDPLGNNKRLNPASLTLGRCPVSSTTALFGYLVFEYQFRDCGFNRLALGSAVKLFVDLVYMPTQIAVNQFSQPFTVPVTCIGNGSMTPSPIDMSTTLVVPASGMGNLNFSFRFMNGDFSDTSNVKNFLLGSPINLELSVNTGFHMPLKLFVDEGIVTPTADITAPPRYDLITNHGCFVDGKVALSRFVKQDPINTIWLTFPAIRFVTASDEIYLTFKLVVWEPKDVTELRKACSYLANGWQLLDWADSSVCTCCDYVCTRSSRMKRGVNDNEDGGLIHTMVLGPFKVHSSSADERSGSIGNESRAAEAGFVMPPAVGALLLELAVLLLVCIGVLLYGRSKRKWEKAEERCLVTAEH